MTWRNSKSDNAAFHSFNPTNKESVIKLTEYNKVWAILLWLRNRMFWKQLLIRVFNRWKLKDKELLPKCLKVQCPGDNILLVASSVCESWCCHIKPIWQIILKIARKEAFNDNRWYHHINKLYCAIGIWKKNISHSFWGET